MTATHTAEAAVKKYLTPLGPDACWEWQGLVTPRGYGRVKVKGRELRAHRVAYTVFVGPIPDGAVIRHHCDNPPCCNPAHLAPGTPAENLQDMVERRRSGFGERNVNAKLTAADAVAIRARYAAGERLASIARDFPVGWCAVRDVVQRKTWKHVGEGVR